MVSELSKLKKLNVSGKMAVNKSAWIKTCEEITFHHELNFVSIPYFLGLTLSKNVVKSRGF